MYIEQIAVTMTAPQIKYWIHVLQGGKFLFDEDVTAANLPYEKDDYEKMLPKITWLEEKKQKLK